MRVIGAGFGRTGTLSLRTALEQLGFGPCYHMLEVMNKPGQLRPWLRAAKGDPDWDTLLSGYNSCVDWPTAAYWKELADHFPEAKLVLTTRDPEKWLASMQATILARRAQRESLRGRMAARLSKLIGTDLAVFNELTNIVTNERVFSGHMDDPEHLLKAFEAHVAEVRATIPAERLLEFEVGQGWEPLCAFLDVPIPEEPFPRVNDGEQFSDRARNTASRMLWHRT
jgi:hypothetical protein